MKVRRLTAALWALMVASLVAGCGTGSPAGGQQSAPQSAQTAAPQNTQPAAPPAGQPVTLRLGVMAVSDCIQAFIADDQGIFKEQGLDVKLQTMKGGAEIAPAVAGGSLEAGWSNMVSIALAHERNLDFVFFSPGMVEKQGNRVHRIMVAKNSPVKSLKDLEGKIVAVNTLDNIPYVAFSSTLQKAGTDLKKVQFVEIPFPNMLAALKEGKVQGAIVPEPFGTAGLTEDSVRVLDDQPFAAFGERAFVASWFASEKWLKANPDVAQRFVTAIRKANAYLAKNPTEARKIMLKYIKLDEAMASKIALGAFDDQVQPADLQPVIDSAVALGVLKQGFAASEILRVQ